MFDNKTKLNPLITSKSIYPFFEKPYPTLTSFHSSPTSFGLEVPMYVSILARGCMFMLQMISFLLTMTELMNTRGRGKLGKPHV